jgi:heme/copper-type cytochrome/quinol oxidase subunit 2
MSSQWAVVVRFGAAMLLFGAAAGISAERPAVARAQDAGPQVFEMTAKKYDFTPTPHVKKGQHFQLKVTATDHDHGVEIDMVPEGAGKDTPPGLVADAPQKCWKVKKGETVTIDLMAQAAGTYEIKCCVDCGMGHRHMKGEIVVE